MLLSPLLLPLTLVSAGATIALVQSEHTQAVLPQGTLFADASSILVTFWIAWLALGVPVWLKPVSKRIEILKQTGLVILALLAGSLPSFVLLCRVKPITLSDTLYPAIIVLLFACLMVSLRQTVTRWYVLISGLLLAGGPLLNWAWSELSLNRSGKVFEVKALLALSPFFSAHEEPMSYWYGVGCGVLLIGLACCYAIGPGGEANISCAKEQPA